MINYFYTLLFGFVFISCNKNSSNCDSLDNLPSISCASVDVSSSTNGFTVNYHPDGVTKESEGNYTNGTQDGFWKFYYTNGNLFKEGNFINKKLNGFWKLNFSNGNIDEQGNYNDCERNGFWKFHYDNNNNSVKKEGNFTEGIKTGTWKYYNEDGSISEEKDC